MRSYAALASVLALAAASFVVGQIKADVGPKQNFQDKAGNMTLSGFTDFQVNATAKTLTFSGTGDVAKNLPFLAKWRDAGITIRAMSMNGDAVHTSPGSYRLSRGDIAGGVSMQFDNRVQNASPPATDTSTTFKFDTAAATYSSDGKTARARISSKFTASYSESDVPVANPTAAKRFAVNLAGSSADFTFPDPSIDRDADVVLDGTIQGPVASTFDRAEGTSKQAKSTIKVQSDKVVVSFGPKGGTVDMIGHVHIEGDDDVYSGEGTAGEAIVDLDENLQPIGVHLKAKAVSKLKQGRGGPSGH